MRRNYSPENLERVRKLRNESSKSEKRLWYDGLADGQLGFRFRRQHPVGPYVLDFYCAEALVCVEVDGESHEERVFEDAVRDDYLSGQGILTLRVSVGDVMQELPSVLSRIQLVCSSRVAPALPESGTPTLPSPSRSAPRGGFSE